MGKALAASLLLHGALLVLLVQTRGCGPNRHEPPPVPPDLIVLEWIDRPPPPPVASAPLPVRPPQSPPQSPSQSQQLTPPQSEQQTTSQSQQQTASQSQQQTASQSQQQTPPQSEQQTASQLPPQSSPPVRGQPGTGVPALPRAAAPTPSDAPVASAPQLDLSPDKLPSGVAIPSHEPPHGHTLLPGDPSLSPGAQRAAEEHRVNERAQEFAWEGIAESRGQPGVAHPWFGEVRSAMRETLGREKGGTPGALGAASPLGFIGQRWLDSSAQYARTGNPSISIPGLTPRQSEIIKERFGEEGQWVQALVQACETRSDLAHGAPLLSVTIELRQGRDGALRSGKILQNSESPAFDAFVMRVVPAALQGLTPPPDEVLHGRAEIRSEWRIEGWPWHSLEQTLTPELCIQEMLQAFSRDNRRFDYRTRLLKAWY